MFIVRQEDEDDLFKESNTVKRQGVCEANDFTEERAKAIDNAYRKTPEETRELRKYNLNKTYGQDITLTPEFVKKFENLFSQYHNLGKMNTEHIDEYLQHTSDEFHKNNNSKVYENAERLHHKNNYLKLHFVNQFLRHMGFKNVWDKSSVQYDYGKAKQFLSQHGEKLSLLFDNDKQDWAGLCEDMNIDNKETKKKLSGHFNKYLFRTCGIRLRRTNGSSTLYKISGLDIWKTNKITIKENNFNNNNFVRNSRPCLIRKPPVLLTTQCIQVA